MGLFKEIVLCCFFTPLFYLFSCIRFFIHRCVAFVESFSMAEGTRFKEVHDKLLKLEALLVEEIIHRISLETLLRDQIAEMQATNKVRFTELQASHDKLRATMEMMQKTLQQHMQSMVQQMRLLNKGKSLMREGSTRSGEGVSEEIGSQWGVEFPFFDGTNARGWIGKCNWYFQFVSSISDHQKVWLASVHLQGRAEVWFQDFVRGRSIPTWEELTLAIIERFDEVVPENLYGDFYKMRQEGSVAEYFERFDELRARIQMFDKDLKEVHFTRCFISGLKEAIKGPVIASKPKGFKHAVSLAKEYERTLGVIMGEVSVSPPTKHCPDKPYKIFASKFRSKVESTAKEVADRAISLLLSIIILSIFTYYAFWTVILPFVNNDHFVHKFFLPQKYAILVPMCTSVVLLSFLSVLIGCVILKTKMKEA